jgi:transcription-repair coupling factor (superfamily II helicase)
MADMVRAKKGLSVFVARDAARAAAFVDALKFFAPGVDTLRMPSWDCLPYDRIGPSPAVSAERMATLSRLARAEPLARPMVLVISIPALMQRVPPRELVKAAGYVARSGQDRDRSSGCRSG